MVYLDSAATTFVLPEAAQAALTAMTEQWYNPSGRYAAAATWYKVLTGNLPAVNAFPEWDAHLIDVIHAGIAAVLG
jgi:hypothetical protein